MRPPVMPGVTLLVTLATLATLVAMTGCGNDDGTPGPVIDTTAPSAVSDLALAAYAAGCSLRVTWTAPGDDATSGRAASYEFRYAAATITADNWSAATPLTAVPTPADAGSGERIDLSELDPGAALHLAMKTRDDAGNESPLSNVITVQRPPRDAHSWRVPCDAGTIQAAIDSAAAGDTVFVPPGTWREQLVMKSGTTVRGVAGADSTIIDGGGLGPVVTFNGVSDAVIEGFTLRGGNAGAPGGGGVFASSSTGAVRSSVITRNYALGFGGGILLSASSFTIMWNQIDHDSSSSHGGGIALIDASTAVIDSNLIEFNQTFDVDSGGGGIYLQAGFVADLRWNVIVRNLGGPGALAGGGGILCEGEAGACRIIHNTVVNNGFQRPVFGRRTGATRSPLHGPGAGIRLSFSGAELRDNIIGQVSAVPQPADYGSALYIDQSDPFLANNDIWNNDSVIGTFFPSYQPPIEETTWTGVNGNLSEDPKLCDPEAGNFAPRPDSPCATASETGSFIGAIAPGCGP